jgi:hypothetical protein
LPLRLVILSDVEGVLEPCGCTRDSEGGIDRVVQAVSELRRTPGPLLFMAAGNLLFSPTQSGARSRSRPREGYPSSQAVLKADALAALLERVGIDVIVPGPADLAHGHSQLRRLARGRTVGLLSWATPLEGLDALVSSRVERAGEHRVALLAVPSAALRDRATAQAALSRSAAQLQQNADLLVAFVHGRDQSTPLPARVDVVVRSGLDQPSGFVSARQGSLQVSAGRHAQELLVLELWPMGQPGSPWQLVTERPRPSAQNIARVERRVLDARAARDPDTRRLVDQVFVRINALNRSATTAAPAGDHESRTRPPYVGARTCAACHTEAYFWWLQTPHARAYETLVARGRELDLDCIGCHVTGFEEPGGARIGRFDELKGVGCESCHGPGGAHVEGPRPPHRSLRRAVVESRCAACHDAAHSDDFNYAEKRDRLIAPGHGREQSARVTPGVGAIDDVP